MLGEAAGSSRWPLLPWSCRYHVMCWTGINACARLVALSHPLFFPVFESFREIDSTYMFVGVCPTTPETAPWLEATSVLCSLVPSCCGVLRTFVSFSVRRFSIYVFVLSYSSISQLLDEEIPAAVERAFFKSLSQSF